MKDSKFKKIFVRIWLGLGTFNTLAIWALLIYSIVKISQGGAI